MAARALRAQKGSRAGPRVSSSPSLFFVTAAAAAVYARSPSPQARLTDNNNNIIHTYHRCA